MRHNKSRSPSFFVDHSTLVLGVHSCFRASSYCQLSANPLKSKNSCTCVYKPSCQLQHCCREVVQCVPAETWSWAGCSEGGGKKSLCLGFVLNCFQMGISSRLWGLIPLHPVEGIDSCRDRTGSCCWVQSLSALCLPELPHLHDVLAGDPAHQLRRRHPQQQGLPPAELHQAAAGQQRIPPHQEVTAESLGWGGLSDPLLGVG